MSSRSAAAWVAAFAALILAATQLIDTERSGPKGQTSAQRGAVEVKVLRVVDGDTIIVRGARGRNERVRYIGVDTPESVKENTPVECFGKEAAAANRRMVEGQVVVLTFDREPRDRFGRTLAYVHVGERFVNAELLREGYARTIEVPPNTSKAEQFSRLEAESRRAGRGLWSACRR